MKKFTFIFLVFIGISFSSCSEDEIDSNNIIGEWKLIEQLADSGDGSAVFKPINSDKTFTFFGNGIVTTNDSLCNPYSEQELISGSFSFEENKIIINCDNTNIAFIDFELKQGFLILNFISNEGFFQKFKKIK